MDTALGLKYLHSLSPPVCHGDIKPVSSTSLLDISVTLLTPRGQENTVIDDDGNAQLCDFGLAQILDTEPSGLTTTNTTSCSLRYAAPEIIKSNKRAHGLESDVWAWGCLVLVVCLGYTPTSTVLTYHLTVAHGRHTPVLYPK